MSIDEDLFAPISGSGSNGSRSRTPWPLVMRTPTSVWVETRRSDGARNMFTDIAQEIMDFAVADLTQLTDVRLPSSYRPTGCMDLEDMIGRFYDGEEHIWISRPRHMQAQESKLTGRFGYEKASRMPANHRPYEWLNWFWVETIDEGRLPAIDLGLMVYKPSNKWWRVFANQPDATDYFNS